MAHWEEWLAYQEEQMGEEANTNTPTPQHSCKGVLQKGEESRQLTRKGAHPEGFVYIRLRIKKFDSINGQKGTTRSF